MGRLLQTFQREHGWEPAPVPEPSVPVSALRALLATMRVRQIRQREWAEQLAALCEQAEKPCSS
jgi:hypothetical protein